MTVWLAGDGCVPCVNGVQETFSGMTGRTGHVTLKVVKEARADSYKVGVLGLHVLQGGLCVCVCV